MDPAKASLRWLLRGVGARSLQSWPEALGYRQRMHRDLVDVSSWKSGGPEQLGSSEKLWLVDNDGDRWLWKAAGFNDDQKVGRFRKGDDWAEWVGSKIAELLGLPAAQVRLAERDGQLGTVGRAFLADDQQLVLGNVLLYETDTAYPKEETGALTQYTVQAVLDVLAPAQPPMGLEDTMTAAQVMTGYLMLDALIANVDRHHENWGVLTGASGTRELAPTFDHGSSLGFLLSDAARRFHLDTNDRNQTPEMWASRARSRFNREHPVAVFNTAAEHEPAAADTWRGRLHYVSSEAVVDLLQAVPAARMSGPSRSFAIRIIEENRRQLLSDPSVKVKS